MPKLVIFAKGKAREIEMGQELTIGRGYSNLLRLEGEEISRVHAILYRRNQDFILRDLDSKNGVFVNGNRVVTATLDAGDRLQVGKYNMVFNPPEGFDFGRQAPNVLSGSISEIGSDASGSGLDISDDNLSHSQIFSAAVPDDSLATGDRHFTSEIFREEVLLLNRVELDEHLRSVGSAATEKAADYQEAFFDNLLGEQVASDGGSAPDFINTVLRAATKAASADRGVVILRDSKTDSLRPGAIVPDKGDVAVNRVVLQSGFGEGKAIICPATTECGLFRDSNTIKRDRIHTLISVPLGRRKIIGLLYIDRQGDDADSFNLAHLLAMARVGRLLELHLNDGTM